MLINLHLVYLITCIKSKIGSFLAISSILGLPKYYILQRCIGKIDLITLCYKITSLLFPEGADTDFSN